MRYYTQMTEKAEILPLDKNLGETPLECLMRYKAEHPEYRDIKMTYLGRLDPMAEGLLLVLAGNTREKAQYLAYDKTYDFEVLWGFKSDSYDILGLVEFGGSGPTKLETKMLSLLKKIQGIKSQTYPLFSSKMFRGNFLQARENNIEELEVAEKKIKIFSLAHVHTRLISGQEILAEVTQKINLVQGDFRQKEIIKTWQVTLRDREAEQFLVSKFTADVSSGTYIRALANEMGKILNTSALAYSIKRTRVGEFRLTGSV